MPAAMRRLGLSKREYAKRAGISRSCVQKARSCGRLVLHPNGSIDAAASDLRRAQATDLAKQRGRHVIAARSVPWEAVGVSRREPSLPAQRVMFTKGSQFGASEGGCNWLPCSIDAKWIKQLVTVETRRSFTRLEWQKLRERNEALDCRVYVRAAAWIAGMIAGASARSRISSGAWGS